MPPISKTNSVAGGFGRIPARRGKVKKTIFRKIGRFISRFFSVGDRNQVFGVVSPRVACSEPEFPTEEKKKKL